MKPPINRVCEIHRGSLVPLRLNHPPSPSSTTMSAAPEPIDLASFDATKLSFSAPKQVKAGNNTTGVSVGLNYSSKALYVKTPIFMRAPFGVSQGYNGGGEKKEARVCGRV